MMLTALYKYLVLNEIVAIPGVGNFTVSKTPATVNASVIHPPQQALSFQAGTALTDKKFYSFLAEEKGVSEVDAVRKFQDFAYQLRKEIQNNNNVELTGLGTFTKTATGDLAFQSALLLDTFFPLIPLKEVVTPAILTNDVVEEEAHGIEVYPEEEAVSKDRWWIWALVLAILALATIGFYFMREDGI